ncbi:MAG: tetratricopeptide repeat protein, partial [bacterium]
MNCTEPDIGKLITLYEFDALSGDERRKFESHLLSCDECFQSLYTLSPVVERMRENPERFLPALQKGDSIWAALKEKIVAVARDCKKAIGRMPVPARIAVPATAAITALLFLFWPVPHLSDLASIEPVPYRPLQVRGGALTGEAVRLFEEGMATYAQNDYAAAAEKLALAVRQDSTNASFHFYLGLCYLLSDSVHSAIEHFQQAIALDGNAVLEKTYWYLGNAWLLKGEREKALEVLRKMVEMEG